jgi:GntR family transcriptional regulator
MEQVAFGSAHQTLTVGRADMETARLLDMDVGGPVAEVRRVITDRSDRVIYVAEIVYRGDFVRLDIQLLGSKKDTIGGTGS